MKNGKFGHKARKSNTKLTAVLVSVALAITLVVGATVAYLVDNSESVTNTFEPAQVTSKVNEPNFNGSSKSNVPITNTSDVTAYIRAEIVATWMAENGNVLHKKPVLNTDYTMTIGSGWTEISGFYYYKAAVPKDEDTGVLIEAAQPVTVDGKNYKEVDGVKYYLSLEIICSAIQADGVKNGVPAVQDAWGEAAARAVGAIQ